MLAIPSTQINLVKPINSSSRMRHLELISYWIGGVFHLRGIETLLIMPERFPLADRAFVIDGVYPLDDMHSRKLLLGQSTPF